MSRNFITLNKRFKIPLPVVFEREIHRGHLELFITSRLVLESYRLKSPIIYFSTPEPSLSISQVRWIIDNSSPLLLPSVRLFLSV